MKKIMGHVTGKLSLSILTMFVLLVGVLAGLTRVTTTKASSIHATQTHSAAMKTAISKMPLVFEPNRGQTDSRVKYFARSAGYNVFLTGPSTAVMSYRPSADKKTLDRLTMKLAGANEAAQGQPQEPTGGVSNYYVGNDKSKWLHDVPNYAKLRYNDVYSGIDVVYQGSDRNFRYDFVVRPGADPKSIRMAYEDAKSVSIDKEGNLVLGMADGQLVGSKPYIYQEVGGKRQLVKGNYVLTAKNEVRFELGRYDASRQVVIDPSVTYASFVGAGGATAGANMTEITGIAVNGSGVYFSGWTNSPTFDGKIITPGTQQAVVGTFNVGLTAVGTTFIGAQSTINQANGIAISGNNLVVVGLTNGGTNFPSPGAANSISIVDAVNFNTHAFVLLLSNAPSLSSSAILAGKGAEAANAVAVDSTGIIHVAGKTSSPDLLTSIKAPGASAPVPGSVAPAQSTFMSQNFVGGSNAFYVALNKTMTAVTYASFLGGYNTDSATAIAVDSKGNAYITGTSDSWGPNSGNPVAMPFPVQPPQPCQTGQSVGCLPPTNPPTGPLTLRTFAGGTHAFVAAFNPNGQLNATGTSTTLLYSLPLGGDVNPRESDAGTAIAVDGNFNVYVGGNVTSPSLANAIPGGGSAGTAGTNGTLNNVVFTAPAIAGSVPGGAGVVANITIINGGSGYTGTEDCGSGAGQVCFSAPQLPGGVTAVGTFVVTGGVITSITITNQGKGYTTPPTITFPSPNTAGGATASAAATIGTIILGTATVGGQDGWVVELGAPGTLTSTFNGGTYTGAPVSLAFPAFVFGTLANGDETHGNGTGTASIAGSVNQVTGLVTDTGATPVGTGTPGALGNIYLSGSSNSASNGNAVLFRRRINTSGFDQITGTGNASLTQTPYLTTFAAQGGAVTALGDINLAPAGAAVIGAATGVAYDTSSGRSCIGAWTGEALATPGTLFTGPPPTLKATFTPTGAGAADGFAACAAFTNDATGNQLTFNFTMVAGATATAPTPTAIQLSPANPQNQTAVSITNPGSVTIPFLNSAVTYTNLFTTPPTSTAGGPASATNAANRWLNTTPPFTNLGGTSMTISLLNINSPLSAVPASNLDPGFYQATFTITPLAGLGFAPDNAGVPITVTVNLIVTGTVLTNTAVECQSPCTPANLNVALNEGSGFTDVGNNTKFLNIPVVSQVPFIGPSSGDVVFDMQRDITNNPVYINSNPNYPVLGAPSITGGVSAVNFVGGSNYPPNTTGSVIFTAPPGGGTTAAATYTVGSNGSIVQVQVTNPGSGYTNPPFVTFPLPNAGGTQATGTATMGGSVTGTRGGTVTLRPGGGLTPGTTGCGSTFDAPPASIFGGGTPGPAMANDLACMIQVSLPPTMLAGAPAGVYTGMFTLLIPNGLLNSPSLAPESAPPSPGTVITFAPVGSTAGAGATSVNVTISVTVGNGGLLLNSPWISNVAPFIANPPTTPLNMPLAPFSVPYGFTGTVNSNNSNVPYIATLTGNNFPNPAIHTLLLDSRDLPTLTAPGTFLTTVTPGINQNAQLAFTENLSVNSSFLSGGLPVSTCTVNSPPIPASVLELGLPGGTTLNGNLPSSNASVTTTEVTIAIVNPAGAGLAPGYYASTVTYSALDSTGKPIVSGTPGPGTPVQISIPVCLEVGNILSYDYLATSDNTVVASGLPTAGGLFMEAGTAQNVWGTVFASGPSQNPQLPVIGGPLFAPPDVNLEVPVQLNNLAGEPSWISPIALPSLGGIQGGNNCHGTAPANSCTPAWEELTVAPAQVTAAGSYGGGFTVANTYPGGTVPTGLLVANGISATLPVNVSSGPAVEFVNPTATTTGGSVFSLTLTNSGSLYSTPPAITFQGGCITEPTAVATVNANGTINGNITLTSLGSGCTTAPIVTIAAPTTAGGVQATAFASLSDSTVNISFTEVAGASVPMPNQQAVWILPSTTGINVTTSGVFFSPTNSSWLTSGTNACSPAQFNPTQSQPGFFNGCSVTFLPNGNVQFLPAGTYYAWNVISAPGSQPATTVVLVTLNVVNSLTAPCSLSITNSTGTSSSSLASYGTSTGGYVPSAPISVTVAPTGGTSCPAWTAASSDPTFVNIVSGASGVGGVTPATLTFNAFGNTHLSARTATITVTAGSASATYTVNETAGTDSQLNREVRALYQRVLGREPDAGGFNYWTCTTPATVQPCANLGSPSQLGQMVDSFLTSQEGTDTDFQVMAIYQSILGRIPGGFKGGTNNYSEYAGAVSGYRALYNTLGNTPNGWFQASTALANTLAHSNEFENDLNSVTVPACTGVSTSQTSLLVTALYQNTLGAAPTCAQLNSGIATVVGGGSSGVYALLFSLWGTSSAFNPTEPPLQMFTNAAYQATTNSQFVDMLYLTVLARTPDTGGFNFWLTGANASGAGIFFNNPAARTAIEGPGTPGVGIVGSPEFQNLFIN